MNQKLNVEPIALTAGDVLKKLDTPEFLPEALLGLERSAKGFVHSASESSDALFWSGLWVAVDAALTGNGLDLEVMPKEILENLNPERLLAAYLEATLLRLRITVGRCVCHGTHAHDVPRELVS